MPYVKQSSREAVDGLLFDIIENINTSGDLNYCMYRLAKLWALKQGINYENLSNCIKTFECAKLEFYRMVLVPYENKKIVENGNVHPIFDFEKNV